jgi:hypothetical protein
MAVSLCHRGLDLLLLAERSERSTTRQSRLPCRPVVRFTHAPCSRVGYCWRWWHAPPSSTCRPARCAAHM